MSRVTLVARANGTILEQLIGAYPYEGCGLLIGFQEEDGIQKNEEKIAGTNITGEDTPEKEHSSAALGR